MIGCAVRERWNVKVYDERGNLIYTIYEVDEIIGYTCRTVAVLRGNRIEIYNESGDHIATIYP